MIKDGDKFLQELREKAEAHRRFLLILSLPKFKIDPVNLYLVLNEERN